MRNRGVILLLVVAAAMELRAQERVLDVPVDTLSQLMAKKRQQVDSLQHSRISRIDSGKENVSGRVDSLTQAVNHSIDSLNRMAASTAELNQRMDTLLRSFQSRLNAQLQKAQGGVTDSVQQKITSLQQQVNKKLSFLDSLRATGHFGDISLPALQTPMSAFQVKASPNIGQAVSVGQLGKINTPALPAANAPGINTGALNLPANELTPKVRHMTGVASDYYQQLQKLEEEGFDSTRFQQLVENRMREMSSVSGIEEAGKPFEDAQQRLERLKSLPGSTDSLKKIGEVMLREELTGHFKDKPQVIEGGMAALAKYQEKFPSLADSRYVPKRRPNLMKDKPFGERLIPGLYFQVRTYPSAWKSIDFSPNVEYWITDRFRAGIGGTYQILMNTKSFSFATNTRSIGFRTVVNYKITEGLFAHGQLEYLRLGNYDNFMRNGTLERPEVWGHRWWIGLSKTYGISKSMRGMIQLLVDPSDWSDIIQGRNVALRFGFEYQIGPKVKREKTK
ncbi:MAG: hypothetical protein JNL17_00315 [Cyclobacteriaceae bacterium]|nr:hypothetical protein [Cyclobacteriaceae bacterium]